jgi:PAS domain S-box-containing protein
MPSAIDLAARLAAIVKIQENIVSGRFDEGAVRSLAVEGAQEVTGADGAVLEIVQPDGDVMYQTASGSLLEHTGTLFPLEGSLSGLCLSTLETLISDDALADPRVNREISLVTGARSIVVAPLVHAGSAVGSLKVVSQNVKAFRELDAYSLQMMAGFIAATIDHAVAYEARKASEARFRLLFDRNLAGAFRSTTDGRLLDANDALAELMGYPSKEALMAEETWNLYPERRDREQMLEILSEQRSVTRHRLHLKKHDGTVIEVLANMDLLPAGRETWLLGTLVRVG